MCNGSTMTETCQICTRILGPIPETIHSRSAQIRSCDPDRPIAFHKRRSRSAHEIEKKWNQTVYCQLNHDINHSLGNLVLKLRGGDWMKNVRLIISIHDVTIGGVAMSFMSADTRASWSVRCMHIVFADDTTRFEHAYLTGMCMWLTSFKIYKLLIQDRPCSTKCFPVVCRF